MVLLVTAALLLAGCGSKSNTTSSGSATSGQVTTTTPATTGTEGATTGTGAHTTQPSCSEVDTFIAELSPNDYALLSKAPFMYVGRGPTGNDTWRVYTQVDVTKANPTPEIAVYYDWSPSTGLSAPTVVKSFAEREALVDTATLQTVVGMKCKG